jgi:nucleoid-associated protein YgaU
MGWGKRLGLATLVFLLQAVAWAAPAGEPEFVPVSIGPGSETEQTVVVEPGDHLWKISQDHLDRELGRRARVGEVAPYWIAVIEANRDGLRSGDPDLIFPGEVVLLPTAGEEPQVSS